MNQYTSLVVAGHERNELSTYGYVFLPDDGDRIWHDASGLVASQMPDVTAEVAEWASIAHGLRWLSDRTERPECLTLVSEVCFFTPPGDGGDLIVCPLRRGTEDDQLAARTDAPDLDPLDRLYAAGETPPLILRAVQTVRELLRALHADKVDLISVIAYKHDRSYPVGLATEEWHRIVKESKESTEHDDGDTGEVRTGPPASST